MTHEQWDAIADAANPVMAIATLVLPVLLTRPNYRGGRVAFYPMLASSLAAMYALGWIDARLHVWASLGLDYSTHTGFAVVLMVSLWMWERSAGAIAATVVMAYAGLMLYQGYHTVADIASTAAIVVLLTLGIHSLRGAMLGRATQSGSAPKP